MKIEVDKGEVDGYVFDADDLNGVPSPDGRLAIDGRDGTDGDSFRVNFEPLGFADLLSDLIEHLTVNGQPAAGVMWDPHKVTVDVHDAEHLSLPKPGG